MGDTMRSILEFMGIVVVLVILIIVIVAIYSEVTRNNSANLSTTAKQPRVMGGSQQMIGGISPQTANIGGISPQTANIGGGSNTGMTLEQRRLMFKERQAAMN